MVAGISLPGVHAGRVGSRRETVPAEERPALCKPGTEAVETYGDGSRVVQIVSNPFYSPVLEQEMREKDEADFNPDGCYSCVEVIGPDKVKRNVPLTSLGLLVEN